MSPASHLLALIGAQYEKRRCKRKRSENNVCVDLIEKKETFLLNVIGSTEIPVSNAGHVVLNECLPPFEETQTVSPDCLQTLLVQWIHGIKGLHL